MAQLTIIYDEVEPPLEFSLPSLPYGRIAVAKLPLADGLGSRDVYEAARKLAELLLEQIEADQWT